VDTINSFGNMCGVDSSMEKSQSQKTGKSAKAGERLLEGGWKLPEHQNLRPAAACKPTSPCANAADVRLQDPHCQYTA
jgi:hypothetical protein